MQLVLLNATKKKEEALQSLRSSLAARQAEPDKVLPALVAAKAAGLDRQLGAMRLAEAVTRPQELCRSLDADSDDCGLCGLVVEDFGTAAKVVAADLDSSELLGECARLAEALASVTEMQLEDGRQTLQTSLEHLRQRSYARAVKDFQSAHEGRMALWQQRRQRAREESAKYVRDLTSEAQRRFATERDAKLEDLRQDLGIALASICQDDAQETQKRVGMIAMGPLETLEAARQESTGQGKVSLSAKLLGATLEEPQEALRALQGETSGFVATLLKDLQVEDAALSAIEIRRSFSSLLAQLAAVALAPPAESLLGRLVSRSLGNTLAKLYELSTFAAPPEAEVSEKSSDVERNLATLTLAAKRLEVNDFAGAVTALEGLTGDCQRRAGSWLRSARQGLLWQQTFEALQAKAS